jgi:hypothetical protein
VGNWGFGGVLVFTLVVVSLMALTLPSIVSGIIGVSGDRSTELSSQGSEHLLKSSAGNCEISVTSTFTVVDNTKGNTTSRPMD